MSGLSGKGRFASCVLVVYAVIFAVPFLVYGTFAAVTGLQPPEGSSPARFMASVAVEKLGHATAFVLIYGLGYRGLKGRWLAYALAWWLMFSLGEVAVAIRSGYTPEMAIAGIIAEALYLPLSAFLVDRLLGTPR